MLSSEKGKGFWKPPAFPHQTFWAIPPGEAIMEEGASKVALFSQSINNQSIKFI